MSPHSILIPPRNVREPASLCIIILLVAFGSTCRSTDPVPQVSSSSADSFWGVESLVHPSTPLRGAASCAASGCHGGPLVAVSSSTAARGSEYPLFVENDPHSRSWQTLNSEDSIAILTKLGILQAGKIVQLKAYENCLACHNTDRSVNDQSALPQIAEGVGCESCHGPSQTWYSDHYQGPSSVRKSKSELGMVDTKPLLQRAKTCTLCHVGSRDRDMNHDIIAAGHPALYFDMAVYHEAYPKHWRETEPNDESFRARLWWAGQVAKADAELELIQARSTAEKSISVWPEFALFQCTSCHQSLDGLTDELTSTSEPNAIDWETLGQATVRRWNLQGIDLLLERWNEEADQRSGSNKSDFNELLSTLNTPHIPSDSVAKRAGDLRRAIAETLNRESPLRPQRWTSRSQTRHAASLLQQSVDTKDWEQAALAYIAAWTAIHSIESDALQGDMATMRNGLVFPFQKQSPLFPRSEASESRPTRQEWSDSVKQVVESLKSAQP